MNAFLHSSILLHFSQHKYQKGRNAHVISIFYGFLMLSGWKGIFSVPQSTVQRFTHILSVSFPSL